MPVSKSRPLASRPLASRPFARATRLAAIAAGALALAGCTTGIDPFRGAPPAQPLPAPVVAAPLGPAQGEVIGSGPTRIALLAPIGAAGAAGQIGQGLRNAAALAMRDPGTSGLQVVVKDTGGTPDGAAAKASEAAAEGASLIIGPLFAEAVRAADTAVQIPVIAFSTDVSTGSADTFLLSFQVATEIERVLGYAASQGRRSLVAVVPATDYGRLAASALRAGADRAGVRVLAVETFEGTTIGETTARLAGVLPQADLVFVPQGGPALASVVTGLKAAGADMNRLQLLGTGVWNEPSTLSLPQAQGGWFAGPDGQGFRLFAQRYAATYGSQPPRVVPLAYDAVRLAANLAPDMTVPRITDPNGFAGTDGIFRFRPGGSLDRGLAVLTPQNGQATVLSAAPTTFQGR